VTAGHFFFIPAVMLVGLVIGWIFGSKAARDAYAAELRRREEREARRRAKQEAGESAAEPTARQ
jgi:heme exporter protein D